MFSEHGYDFDPAFPLSRVRPAEYNPRALSPARAAALKESINTIGLLRPVIVTKDGLLVAGHQRSRTLKELGFLTTPAVAISAVKGEKINLTDEINFNQMHNSADIEQTDGVLTVTPYRGLDWDIVTHGGIVQVTEPTGGNRRHEIMNMMIRFANWGSCVATKSGRVVACQLYASAAKILRRPILVRYVEDELEDKVRHYFGQEYGRFSYGHLPQTPWVQTLAQMMRLRPSQRDGKPIFVSSLYQNRVWPVLTPAMRMLDFGAGQMDHAKDLIRRGYQVTPVEFYHRKTGSMDIDYNAVQHYITKFCEELEARGRFDMVIADSVINSVTTVQAEADVLNCLNAFCKPNGLVAFCTRSREKADKMALHNRTTGDDKQVYFIDDDGFTGTFSKGVWLYQKFHTAEQVKTLARRHFGPKMNYLEIGKMHTEMGFKTLNLPDDVAEAAIRREFDLPLPDGRTVGRGDDAVRAWKAAKSKN